MGYISKAPTSLYELILSTDPSKRVAFVSRTIKLIRDFGAIKRGYCGERDCDNCEADRVEPRPLL